MNVKDTELLPCPFCGKQGRIKYERVGNNYAAYIQCSECKTRTKSIVENTDYCATDEAAKLWNRRVPSNHNKEEQ